VGCAKKKPESKMISLYPCAGRFDATRRYEDLRLSAFGIQRGPCSSNELGLFLCRGMPGWLELVAGLEQVHSVTGDGSAMPIRGPQTDMEPISSGTWKEEIVSLLSSMILQCLEVAT
jgi:hypothetical protein